MMVAALSPWLLALVALLRPSIGAAMGGSNVLGYGPAGALMLGREDLIAVRASLGRISTELQAILNVIDTRLSIAVPATDPSAPPLDASPESQPDPDLERAEYPHGVPLPRHENFVYEPPPSKLVQATRWLADAILKMLHGLVHVGVFGLDVAIVVGMGIFLDSVSGKRRRGIMSITQAANERDLARDKLPPGASIPTPTATRESKLRLQMLTNEEVLVAYLNEYGGKLSLGIFLAFAFRIIQLACEREGVASQLWVSLAMMLRCMSVVMFFIKDELCLPKPDKDGRRNARESDE